MHDTLEGGVGEVRPDGDVVVDGLHVCREPVVLLGGLGSRGRHGERMCCNGAVPGVQERSGACEG